MTSDNWLLVWWDKKQSTHTFDRAIDDDDDNYDSRFVNTVKYNQNDKEINFVTTPHMHSVEFKNKKIENNNNR